MPHGPHVRLPTHRRPCLHDRRQAGYRLGRAHPWPGRMRTCWTTHNVSWRHRILQFPLTHRAWSHYSTFYVAAVVKPPWGCFFPPFWTLWHRASIALAPSCGGGTSRLARLSRRAGSHARQPLLEALERHEQRETWHRPACQGTSLDAASGCDRSCAVRAVTRRDVDPDAPESLA